MAEKDQQKMVLKEKRRIKRKQALRDEREKRIENNL
jgi:hypothetical protein